MYVYVFTLKKHVSYLWVMDKKMLKDTRVGVSLGFKGVDQLCF